MKALIMSLVMFCSSIALSAVPAPTFSVKTEQLGRMGAGGGPKAKMAAIRAKMQARRAAMQQHRAARQAAKAAQAAANQASGQ